LEEERQKQILLLAPDLVWESLAIKFNADDEKIKIVASKEDLTQHPKLVIWYLDNSEVTDAIQIELLRLKERWLPAPILLIVPPNINLNPSELLKLDCSGLVQDPSLKNLKEDIYTLINGGRVVRIKEDLLQNNSSPIITLGLGQWLLISGLDQINEDLSRIEEILKTPPSNPIILLLIIGRKRELNSAKSVLNFLWGKPILTVRPIIPNVINISDDPKYYKTQITISSNSSISIWETIYSRLNDSIKGELTNSTGQILAIQAIKTIYQKDLFVSLLTQLDQSIRRIQTNINDNETDIDWNELQLEIRQNAVRSLIGNYVRLPKLDEMIPVNDELINLADFSEIDEELPNSKLILDPLVSNKPVLVDGQYLSVDNPRSILRLEILFSNWLVRTAEIISAELLNVTSQWHELRNYLLDQDLISTRELERLRNQLNAQSQWQKLIKRPIRLYESKRILYTIDAANIKTYIITESRDDELKELSWLQQQVALIIETRDALAPQVQSLVKYLGDLMVVVLTKIVGRAIGLIGKGIAQGMGRTFSKG
tara:strand:+ start:10228 stop:11853 length:1626 start_codon:yes stop_codon:yes gene_type:complete